MWVAEGLTHRYPTKVLAELLSTCPQYCGHCTRMDLVGNSTPSVDKLKLVLKPVDRQEAHMAYLRTHPQVRDVVVSGGDVANLPWARLESYLDELLDIDNIRDIRLATKALMALPQHWLSPDVVDGMGRVADQGPRAWGRRWPSTRTSTTPRPSRRSWPRRSGRCSTPACATCATRACCCEGVNATSTDLLDLCFTLLDGAGIMPYYFYMCDMIPNAEHWRVPLAQGPGAAARDHGLPARVRDAADRLRRARSSASAGCTRCTPTTGVLGISDWTKNYRTGDRVRRPERADAHLRATTTRSTPCPRRASAGGPGMPTRTPAERSS